MKPELVEYLYAQRFVIRGALQVAASRLLQQGADEARGEAELSEGIRTLERIEVEARERQKAAEDAKLAARREALKARRWSSRNHEKAENAKATNEDVVGPGLQGRR